MKRVVSLLMTLVLLAGMMPAALAESTTTYIPAPYTVPEGGKVTDTYHEPVYYVNENGPTIGVTMVGVLEIDGMYFKDSDNDKELDVFEDWRIDAQTRAEDMVSKMSLEEQAGFIMNGMFFFPNSATYEDALDENGNVVFDKVLYVYEEGGEKQNMDSPYGGSLTFDQRDLTEKKKRAAVYRGGARYQASTLALFNNAANQIIEYDSGVASGTPSMPWTTLTNPIVINYPSALGLASAVMGDVAAGGDYSLVLEYAQNDGELLRAEGIQGLYGPQIDLITDPRWPRNMTTYTEVPEVAAGIAAALVEGYQNGTDGLNEESVVLAMKHFPGDGAAENGWESHYPIGMYRIYETEGSLEKYQLVAWQAAIDAGIGAIMPCYSVFNDDPRSAKQTYRGIDIIADNVGTHYSDSMIDTLLFEAMGFKGYINSDSTVATAQAHGVDELSVVERYAALISNGMSAIGSEDDPALIVEAVETGLLPREDLSKANAARAKAYIEMGRVDNPYLDAKAADEVYQKNVVEKADKAHLAQQKSVVLLKNTDATLPLTDTAKKLYVRSFTDDEDGSDATLESLQNEFAARGYTIVEDYEDADVALLAVEPLYNVTTNGGHTLGVLDLVEEIELPERDTPHSQAFTGYDRYEVTTLAAVEDIKTIADAVHANGGKVVSTIRVSQPWILTNLEPYCDALIAQFGNTVAAQVDVMTGVYNPTGKLPVTMVSCNEVIATEWVTLEDGNEYEICVSPNDVPGYDKDQYIDLSILENVPGGSYAYCDSEGNYYRAWFGLSY